MAIDSIYHTFFDIDVEHVDDSDELHLIKILSIDGRRFTYELRGPLTEEAVAYVKKLLDMVVFGDIIIEQGMDGFEARESHTRLKKHS
jgi:hypothetical protein